MTVLYLAMEYYSKVWGVSGKRPSIDERAMQDYEAIMRMPDPSLPGPLEKLKGQLNEMYLAAMRYDLDRMQALAIECPRIAELYAKKHGMASIFCFVSGLNGERDKIRELVNWLVGVFNPSEQDQWKLLQHACSAGNMPIVEYLVEQYGLGAAGADGELQTTGIHNALLDACSAGKLTAVQYLVERYKIDVSYIVRQKGVDSVLQRVVHGGHHAIATWLTDKFQLDQDASICRNELLSGVCHAGNLVFAEWMVDKFAITADDVRKFDGMILWMACEDNKPEIVQWLIRRFNLTPDDVRAGDMALRYAPKGSELKAWLTTQYYQQ